MAELVHTLQDDVTPKCRRLRVQYRVVGGRVLDQTCQHCRLREGELIDVHVEIVFRRGFHPVGAVPEVGYVQIPFKNLILAQVLLEVKCVACFPEFTFDGLLGRGFFCFPGGRGLQEDVLHVLLG